MHLLASEIFGHLRLRDTWDAEIHDMCQNHSWVTCMNGTVDVFSNLMEDPEIFGCGTRGMPRCMTCVKIAFG